MQSFKPAASEGKKRLCVCVYMQAPHGLGWHAASRVRARACDRQVQQRPRMRQGVWSKAGAAHLVHCTATAPTQACRTATLAFVPPCAKRRRACAPIRLGLCPYRPPLPTLPPKVTQISSSCVWRPFPLTTAPCAPRAHPIPSCRCRSSIGCGRGHAAILLLLPPPLTCSAGRGSPAASSSLRAG